MLRKLSKKCPKKVPPNLKNIKFPLCFAVILRFRTSPKNSKNDSKRWPFWLPNVIVLASKQASKNHIENVPKYDQKLMPKDLQNDTWNLTLKHIENAPKYYQKWRQKDIQNEA